MAASPARETGVVAQLAPSDKLGFINCANRDANDLPFQLDQAEARLVVGAEVSFVVKVDDTGRTLATNLQLLPAGSVNFEQTLQSDLRGVVVKSLRRQRGSPRHVEAFGGLLAPLVAAEIAGGDGQQPQQQKQPGEEEAAPAGGWRLSPRTLEFSERDLGSARLNLRPGDVVLYDLFREKLSGRQGATNIRLIRGGSEQPAGAVAGAPWHGVARQQGRIVTWFEDKNFGFIQPIGHTSVTAAIQLQQEHAQQSGSKGQRDHQVFFHGSQLIDPRATAPSQNAAVEFNLATDEEGRPVARHVQLLPKTDLCRKVVPAEFLQRTGSVAQQRRTPQGQLVWQIADSQHPQILFEFSSVQVQSQQQQQGRQSSKHQPPRTPELFTGDIVSFRLPSLGAEMGHPKQDNPRMWEVRPKEWEWMPEPVVAAAAAADQPSELDLLRQWKRASLKQLQLVEPTTEGLQPGLVFAMPQPPSAGASIPAQQSPSRSTRVYVQPLRPEQRHAVHFGRQDVVGTIVSTPEGGDQKVDIAGAGSFPQPGALVFFRLADRVVGKSGSVRASRVFLTEVTAAEELASSPSERVYRGTVEFVGRNRGVVKSSDPALQEEPLSLSGHQHHFWFADLPQQMSVSSGTELGFRVVNYPAPWGGLRATDLEITGMVGTVYRLLSDQTGLIWSRTQEPIPFRFEDVVVAAAEAPSPSAAEAVAAEAGAAQQEPEIGEAAGVDAPVAAVAEDPAVGAASEPQPQQPPADVGSKKQSPQKKKLNRKLFPGQMVRFELSTSGDGSKRAVNVQPQQGWSGKMAIETATVRRYQGRVCSVPGHILPSAELTVLPDGRVKKSSKGSSAELDAEAFVEIIGSLGESSEEDEAKRPSGRALDLEQLQPGQLVPLNTRVTAPAMANARLQEGDLISFAVRYLVVAPEKQFCVCSSLGDLQLLVPRQAVVLQSQRRGGFFSGGGNQRGAHQSKQAEKLLATLLLLPLQSEEAESIRAEIVSDPFRKPGRLMGQAVTFINDAQLFGGQSLSRGDLVEVGGFQNNPQLRTTVAIQIRLLERAPAAAGRSEGAAGSSGSNGGGGDVILSSLARGPPDEEAAVRATGFSRPRTAKCWIVVPSKEEPEAAADQK